MPALSPTMTQVGWNRFLAASRRAAFVCLCTQWGSVRTDKTPSCENVLSVKQCLPTKLCMCVQRTTMWSCRATLPSGMSSLEMRSQLAQCWQTLRPTRPPWPLRTRTTVSLQLYCSQMVPKTSQWGQQLLLSWRRKGIWLHLLTTAVTRQQQRLQEQEHQQQQQKAQQQQQHLRQQGHSLTTL